MPVSCTPGDLAELAKCFEGMSPKQAQAAITYLLCQIANATPSESAAVYRALLTQSSTNAPTAEILENTIGNIVWSYDGPGHYRGTLTGAFTLGKTAIIINTSQEADTITIASAVVLSADAVLVSTSFDPVGGIKNNDVLSRTFIQILVYP